MNCVEVVANIVRYLPTVELITARNVSTLWRELSTTTRISRLSCEFLSRVPVQEEAIELTFPTGHVLAMTFNVVTEELYVCTSSNSREILLFTHDATRSTRAFDEFSINLRGLHCSYTFQGPYFIVRNLATGSNAVFDCRTKRAVNFLESGTNNGLPHGGELNIEEEEFPPDGGGANNLLSPVHPLNAHSVGGLFASSKTGDILVHWLPHRSLLRVYTPDGMLRCEETPDPDVFPPDVDTILVEDSGAIVGCTSDMRGRFTLYCLELDFTTSIAAVGGHMNRSKLISIASLTTQRSEGTLHAGGGGSEDNVSELRGADKSSLKSSRLIASRVLAHHGSSCETWSLKCRVVGEENPPSSSAPSMQRLEGKQQSFDSQSRGGQLIPAVLDGSIWRGLCLKEKCLYSWDTRHDRFHKQPLLGGLPKGKGTAVCVNIQCVVSNEIVGAMLRTRSDGLHFAAMISCDGTITRTFQLAEPSIIAFHPREAVAVVASEIQKDVSQSLLLEALGEGIGNMLYFGKHPATETENEALEKQANNFYWWCGVLCYVAVSVALLWTVTALIYNGWLGHLQHLFRD